MCEITSIVSDDVRIYSVFMLTLKLKYAYEYSARMLGGPAHIRLSDGRYMIYSFRGFITPAEARAKGARPVKMHAYAYSLDGGNEHPWVELEGKHVLAAMLGKDVYVIVAEGKPRIV